MVAKLNKTEMNTETEQELVTPTKLQLAEKAVLENFNNFVTAIITSTALSS